ncbi:hypothetical protein AVEN_240982-1 [Araneus ventricosus]|uniref:WAP domain-containing protein n=1 Tax=Araneus ventricosus TaxID=182803 RepID=A0A4Y2RH14_ARAVE|nr:hypothetical protein AVEN_240982-1 [Araneus ventricosus]
MKTIAILLLVSLTLSIVEGRNLDICPQREFDPIKGCGVRKNQCCKNSDCENLRDFCCIDYCGNRCKSYKLGDAKEKKYQYNCEISYPFP